MKDIGPKIFKTDRGSKAGPTEANMRENIRTGRSMGREYTSGRTEAITLACGIKITSTDTVSTFGRTAAVTRGSGNLIKCTDMEFTYGKTEDPTKGNIYMTKSTAMVNINGQTEGCLKENG
jgi:hypothetical protein